MQILVKDIQKFKELIILNGFSQRGLARTIGITSGFMSEVANGNKNPGPMVAKLIANELGVDMEEIFLLKSANKSKQSKEEGAAI